MAKEKGKKQRPPSSAVEQALREISSQLDRIEKNQIRLERKFDTKFADLHDRMEEILTQEEELNTTLTEHFDALGQGLDAIQAKLDAAGNPVDLTDEIQALRDSTTTFKDRVAGMTGGGGPVT
jgi:uncharacterized protein YhaN